jgi:hypothetical protein
MDEPGFYTYRVDALKRELDELPAFTPVLLSDIDAVDGEVLFLAEAKRLHGGRSAALAPRAMPGPGASSRTSSAIRSGLRQRPQRTSSARRSGVRQRPQRSAGQRGCKLRLPRRLRLPCP